MRAALLRVLQSRRLPAVAERCVPLFGDRQAIAAGCAQATRLTGRRGHGELFQRGSRHIDEDVVIELIILIDIRNFFGKLGATLDVRLQGVRPVPTARTARRQAEWRV